jgi:signal transduction histidine kinase/ActR/RegA family two-component response regulator
VAEDVEPGEFYKPAASGPGQRRWARWLAGFAAACAVMAFRGLFTPWLGHDLTLLLAFPAIALVALFCGVGPGILASLVCAFWTLIPWPEPTAGDAGLQASIFLPAAILVALAAGRFQYAEPAAERSHPGLVPRQDSVIGWLRLSMVLAAVLPAAFYAFAAAYSYRHTFDEVRLWLDGMARVTQEHASKVFQTNEVVLARAFDAVGSDEDEKIRGREADLHLRLREMAQGIDHLHDIRVWNLEGQLLASSIDHPVGAVTITDLSLIRGPQEPAGRGGEPQSTLGWLPGEDTLQFSQRRSQGDRGFDGIITLGIAPGYFTDFYKQFVQSEPGLVMSLLGDDGTALAHWPPTGDAARQPELMTAVRQLPGYPFRVQAAIARGAVLGQWYRNLMVLAVFTFPTALALIMVASVALRRARLEREAVERLRDESERRLRIEESLRQSQKLEAIGRMTGGVAHDVNNLLMVIDSNVQLIRKLEPGMAHSPQVDAIANTARTGERLMRQLLAFSRRQALNPEVIRLQERISALVALVRTTLGGSIRIDVHVDEDTAAIEVDTAELELAMLNLAVNARDAMPGQGVLTIRARNLPAGEMPDLVGRFVELAVADTGAGIDPKDLPYVLEPFFTTKEAGKGTGLGLSQVYGLCAQAGGTVRVESKPGKGTRIRLFFQASGKPLAQPEDLPAAMPRLSCRVLLVEDNREVAEASRQLLESFGCSVEHAIAAEAAQEMLVSDTQPFDVLLSDIAMPGAMSGMELAEWVRQNRAGMPVVLMTGYAEELRRAKALAFTVLQKPVSAQALAATLARARRHDGKASLPG